MRKPNALRSFEAYVNCVNGFFPPEPIPEKLSALEQAARLLIAKLPDPHKGGEAQKRSAKQIRDNQLFVLSWRSGSNYTIIGWNELSKHLRLKESSIQVKLSRGNKFHLTRVNPNTEAEDVLTVTRPPKTEPPKAKLGRPKIWRPTEPE